MRLEDKNDALGKLCGWVHEPNTPFERHATCITSPSGAWWHPDVAGASFCPPDYFRNADRCSEAELFIKDNIAYAEQWEAYGRLLLKRHPSCTLWTAEEGLDYWDLATFVADLTPSIKSDCLGIALGLWKEGE
jgi:hypothetical protein